MELAEPGFGSMIVFGLIVLVGGLIMAAISFFSMKETSFEDVVAEQKRKKQQEDKERSRLNKQKREHFKEKFKHKKKKEINGKVSSESGVSPAHEVQIKPTPPAPSQAKQQAAPTKPTPKPTKTTPKPIKPTPQQTKPAPAPTEPKKKTKLAKQAEETTQKKKEVIPEPKVVPVVSSVQKSSSQPVAKTASKPEATEPAGNKGKPAKGRKQKVSFSEDGHDEIKPVEAALEETQKSKKKKPKKDEEENPVVDLLKSADVDTKVAKKLIDIIKQKAGNEILFSISEFAELKKELKSKDAENQRNQKESLAGQKLIQDLQNKMENEKDQNMKTISSLEAELSTRKKNQNDLQSQLQMIQEQTKRQQVATVNVDSHNKLKEENNILKLTVASNASKVQELALVKDQLQKSEAAKSELERKLQNGNGPIQQRQAEIEASYSQRIDEMTQQLQKAQAECDKRESDILIAQRELQLTQTESAKLLDQVVQLNEKAEQKSIQEEQYASLISTKEMLEKRLEEMDAKDNEKADELAKLYTLNKDLTKMTEQHSKDLEKLNIELGNAKNEVNSMQEERKEFENQLKTKDARICDLEKQSTMSNDAEAKLLEEIEKLKKKNNELREKNWKAMDAVSISEKMAKDRIANAKDELEKSVSTFQADMKNSLQKAFPSVQCNSKNFEEWISQFLSSASQSIIVQNNEADDVTRKDLEAVKQEKDELELKTQKLSSKADALQMSLNAALQRNKEYEEINASQDRDITDTRTELEKFRIAIASTESLLIQLQNNAEKEEEEREQLLQEANEEKERVLQEEKRLREEIEMTLNEKCGALEEMTNECQCLKEKLSEAQTQLNDSNLKLNEISSNHDDSNPQQLDVQTNGHDDDEINKLKDRLEKEKKLTKDLGTAAGKLQTVLKQTQEQLNKERKKNRELIQKYSKSDKDSSSSSSSSELD